MGRGAAGGGGLGAEEEGGGAGRVPDDRKGPGVEWRGSTCH